jgi:hypothetical protein
VGGGGPGHDCYDGSMLVKCAVVERLNKLLVDLGKARLSDGRQFSDGGKNGIGC